MDFSDSEVHRRDLVLDLLTVVDSSYFSDSSVWDKDSVYYRSSKGVSVVMRSPLFDIQGSDDLSHLLSLS